jgi:hypothetical protein
LTGGGRSGTCEDCGAGLARAQSYCLGCGKRVGPASPQLLELLHRVRGPDPAGSAALDGAAGDLIAGTAGRAEQLSAEEPPPPDGLLGRFAELRIPSARVSALLVLAFAGFGVLLGNVAGSRVDHTLAASARPHLKLLLPAASAAPGTSTPAAPAIEPPAASAEVTPEPAGAEEPAAAPAPAVSPAPSTGSPAPSRSSGTESGGGEGGSQAPASGKTAAKLPAIKHVFVVMLSDQPYAAVFGPSSTAPYLSRTLERRGELLVRYYAVAHQQLANEIALLSGQGPTAATAANCPSYGDVSPATTGAAGQVVGDGCVYPRATETLAGQLTAKHLSWRAYVQGMDEPGSASAACGHPTLGAPDPSAQAAPAGQPYATFHNPFVYFHSLIDSPSCATDDVGLNALDPDLSSAGRTPSLSYIVPDRCHDGSPGPCPGAGSGGLPAADGFLQQVIPRILGSKAYKDGGLLLITVDQAPTTGEFADSSSCCGQPRFPNLPAPTGVAAALPPEGGGQVGALMLSPFVKPGTTSQEPYNHYSLLRTIEDLFSLKHLGYAGGAHAGSLEPSLFAAKSG